MADNFLEFYTRNTRRVSAVVDQTEFELRENMGPIEALSPVQNYDAAELLLLKTTGDITVASLVAPDQELPNDQGQMTLKEEILSRLLIGKQHVFLDKEYEMLEKMRTYMASGGANGRAIVQATEKYLLGLAADMPVAIDFKMLILMFQVWTTGACDYTDPLTGHRVKLNYGDIVSALFPNALTGTARWQDAANADGLSNFESIGEAWRGVHGSKPRIVLAHYADLRNLADQDSTKNAFAAMAGTDSTLAGSLYIPCNYNPQTLELESGPLLEMIRARSGVERVLVCDRKYTETLKDGTKNTDFFLPESTIAFLDPAGMYERARVPFKENKWRPGVYVLSEEVQKLPLRERIAGMTAGMPFVKDGRYLCAQKIDGPS